MSDTAAARSAFAPPRGCSRPGSYRMSSSSDGHPLSIKGPAFDQLVTMSKFLCLGMELADAIRASTAAPAAALGRTDIGRLEVGAIGDATVLELAEGDFEYRDVLGEVRAGRQRLKARGVVLAGSWCHPPRA